MGLLALVAVQAAAVVTFGLALRTLASRIDSVERRMETDVEGLARQLRDKSAPARRAGLRRGTMAPPFTLTDSNGAQFSLEDFSERRLLLLFVSSHCGPCSTVLREVGENPNDDRWDDVVVIVTGDQSIAPEIPRGLRWAADSDGAVAALYHVQYPPVCAVVGRDGRVTISGVARTRNDVEKLAMVR